MHSLDSAFKFKSSIEGLRTCLSSLMHETLNLLIALSISFNDRFPISSRIRVQASPSFFLQKLTLVGLKETRGALASMSLVGSEMTEVKVYDTCMIESVCISEFSCIPSLPGIRAFHSQLSFKILHSVWVAAR